MWVRSMANMHLPTLPRDQPVCAMTKAKKNSSLVAGEHWQQRLDGQKIPQITDKSPNTLAHQCSKEAPAMLSNIEHDCIIFNCISYQTWGIVPKGS